MVIGGVKLEALLSNAKETGLKYRGHQSKCLSSSSAVFPANKGAL